MFLVVFENPSQLSKRTFGVVHRVFTEWPDADERARRVAANLRVRAWVVEFPDPPALELVTEDAPAVSRETARFVPPLPPSA